MKFFVALSRCKCLTAVMTAGLFSASLTSCATGPAAPKLTDAQICTTIKYIISEADGNFAEIRIRKVIHPQADIWESKKIFPDSKQCQIWSWSQGLTNYACMWEEKSF